MPDVQINYKDMEELVDQLEGNAITFDNAFVNIGHTLALVHEDGLDGKAGKQLLDSLRALQKKLASARTLFENLAKEVQKATDEMKERDNAAKF